MKCSSYLLLFYLISDDERSMSWLADSTLLVPTPAMTHLCFTTLYNHLRNNPQKVLPIIQMYKQQTNNNNKKYLQSITRIECNHLLVDACYYLKYMNKFLLQVLQSEHACDFFIEKGCVILFILFVE